MGAVVSEGMRPAKLGRILPLTRVPDAAPLAAGRDLARPASCGQVDAVPRVVGWSYQALPILVATDLQPTVGVVACSLGATIQASIAAAG